MGIYRKNLLVDLIISIAMIILGFKVSLLYFIPQAADVINLVYLGVFILLIALVVIIYRQNNQDVIGITEKEYKTIRFSVYGYFGIFVAQLIILGNASLYTLFWNLFFTGLMIFIGLFTLILHIIIIKRSHQS